MTKKLLIEGMKCKHCKQNLNDALTEDIKGVEVIEISIEEGYALVNINEDVHNDDIKDIVEDLGFKYLRASNKEEFEGEYKYFISSEITDNPMIFEVFTQVEAENEALRKMMEIEISSKNKLKNSLKNILGESIVDAIKKCRN